MKSNNPKINPLINDERARLISVRLEPRIVRAIDNWVKAHPIYTRSEVINRLLYSCLSCATPLEFEELVTTYHPEPNTHMLSFQSVKAPQASV